MSADVAASREDHIFLRPDVSASACPKETSVPIAHLWDGLGRRIGKILVDLPPSTWMLLDIGLIFVAVPLAFSVFPPPLEPDTPHIALWQAMVVFAFALALASMVFGLYQRETVLSRSRIAARLILTAMVATVITYALVYVVMYSTVSRRITAMVLMMHGILGLTARFVACWAVYKIHRGLLIVGNRALFESFEAAQSCGMLPEYQLVGYASPSAEPKKTLNKEIKSHTDDKHELGPIHDLTPMLARRGVTDVVTSSQAARDPGVMKWIVSCLQQGCRVTNEGVFYETTTGQILVDEITPDWFLFADLKVHCDRQATVKRFFDITLAIVGLIGSLPLWPLMALVIKLGDGGPVFYSQKRVGQHGRLFTLYKFRTMKNNAENGKSVWASPNDPRITRMGRWLRKSRLDELPQLYNILKGDMSVVGPRPERPDLVEELATHIPYFKERHLVKPGLTGWAQISFRYGASIEDAKQKLQFDLYYLKHISLELDIIIILRTVGTFLRGGC